MYANDSGGSQKKIPAGIGRRDLAGLGCAPQSMLSGNRRGLGVAPAVAMAASKIHISLKTPSEKRAANVLSGVVNAANAGNLRAVAILDSRRSLGISKERAVWASGYNRVRADVLANYAAQRNALIAAIPASAQKDPEAAAAYAKSGGSAMVIPTVVPPSSATIQDTPGVMDASPPAPPSVVQKILDFVVPVALETKAGQDVRDAVVQSAVNAQVEQTKANVTNAVKNIPLPVWIVGGYLLLRAFGRKR